MENRESITLAEPAIYSNLEPLAGTRHTKLAGNRSGLLFETYLRSMDSDALTATISSTSSAKTLIWRTERRVNLRSRR